MNVFHCPTLQHEYFIWLDYILKLIGIGNYNILYYVNEENSEQGIVPWIHKAKHWSMNQDNEKIFSPLFVVLWVHLCRTCIWEKINSWMKLYRNILEVILFAKDLWDTEQGSCCIEITICSHILHIQSYWSLSNSKAVNRGLKVMNILRERELCFNFWMTGSELCKCAQGKNVRREAIP